MAQDDVLKQWLEMAYKLIENLEKSISILSEDLKNSKSGLYYEINKIKETINDLKIQLEGIKKLSYLIENIEDDIGEIIFLREKINDLSVLLKTYESYPKIKEQVYSNKEEISKLKIRYGIYATLAGALSGILATIGVMLIK